MLAIDADRFLYGAVPVLRLGGSPGALAVSRGGRMIYLADSPDSIIPVSAVTGKPGKPIPVSGGTTGDLVSSKLTITPDGRTLWAMLIGFGGGGVPQLVRVDLRTGKETGQVQVPGGAYDFVLSSDGATLYVVSGDHTLVAVDAVTCRPERRIPVPGSLLASEGSMVLSPDGGTLYVATTDQDAQARAVTPVSLRTGAPGRAVSVGWEPESLAITPDGRTLYAAVDGMMGPSGQVAPNRVVAIDTATDRVRASLLWRAPPFYLAMAPNGATLGRVDRRRQGEHSGQHGHSRFRR
jgi:sugar lactone lactonase YvrE